MTTEDTTGAGRYLTLHDYLRVLRRYWLIIAALAIVGGGLGYFDAKRQTPVYEASSSVSFQDPSQDLSIVGFGSNSVESPSQLAATASDTVTQPAVLAQVARQLNRSTGQGSLAGAISPLVSATNGNLQIGVRWTNPQFAAQLANAVAQVIVARSNQSTQARFRILAHEIQGRIARLQTRATGLRPTPRTTEAGTQLLFYDDELARIDTLRAFARSAQVATIALPPGAPTSPKTLRSAILGFVLGLLLGLLFAFVRDALDRRLRSPRDIESTFHLPVLGYVREEAMGQIARASDGSKRNDRQLDVEAFKIVRRNLDFLADESSSRSIVITSGLPEEGKTTVAGSLAFAMAAAGRRTLLVDCDLRRSTLSNLLELEQSPGLTDFLVGDATPEQILRTVDFNAAPSLNGSAPQANGQHSDPSLGRLVCIPAGSPTTRAAELLGSNQFKEFLEQVSQIYDAVILDSSPLLPVADTLEMLPHVDTVIVCAREFQTTRSQAAAAKTALSHLPDRPTGLVVTGVRPHGDEHYGYAYYKYP